MVTNQWLNTVGGLELFWLNQRYDKSFNHCTTIKILTNICSLYLYKILDTRLETFDYLDNLMRRERFNEQVDAITFDGEVDDNSFVFCQTT